MVACQVQGAPQQGWDGEETVAQSYRVSIVYKPKKEMHHVPDEL